MTARVLWLTDSAWPGLDEPRARVLESLRSSASLLILEPPAPLRLPGLTTHRIDGVTVGQVMPLLNTRVRRAQVALRQPLLRALADRAAGYQVARHARAAWGTHPSGPLHVVCSNVFLHRAARSLAPDRLIVEISHDPRSLDGAPQWAEDTLIRAAREADVVVTPLLRLARELREKGIRDVRLRHEMPGLGGVDVLVEALELGVGAPARDAGIARERSVVEFRGRLGRDVDFPLVDELARRCPDLRVRLIGPVDATVAPRVREIADLPNVQLVARPREGRAGAAAAAPAAAIFPLSQLSPGPRILPASAIEEVGPGIPIVSTARPETSSTAHPVDVCCSRERFIQTVRLRAYRRVAGSRLWDRALSDGSRRAA